MHFCGKIGFAIVELSASNSAEVALLQAVASSSKIAVGTPRIFLIDTSEL